MKRTVIQLVWAGAVIIVSTSNIAAQGEDKPGDIYLNANIGPNFIQDTEIKGTGGLKASFYPGVRADAGVGYDFSPYFSSELESAIIWNSVNKFDNFQLSQASSGADYYQFPLLINLVSRNVMYGGRLTSYLTGGIGGIASVLDARGPFISGTDSAITFAYQAGIAVKYSFTERMEIGAGYKFLGTLNQTWKLSGLDFQARPILNHSIEAAFTWHF